MSDKVIEPSEILIDYRGKVGEKGTVANPWARFLARFFDYSLFFLFLFLMRHLFHGTLPLGSYERLVPFEYFVWIPIEALFLSTWGTTPGKFFLRIKITPFKGKKLPFIEALRRSFLVWFRGFGMGIPIINALCMLFAYHRLKSSRQTSWDKEGRLTISHALIARWKIIAVSLIAFGGMLVYLNEKNREIQQTASVKKQNGRFF